MADDARALTMRAFERLRKDSQGKKYTALQTALKEYLDQLRQMPRTLEVLEAELLLQPLRLAIETKQSKLVETALDCLHKLISYGHLEGEAGIKRGKNGPILTDILAKVWSCIDSSATDCTVLQVIKVLLTAVASSKFKVHGECLLNSIRTCYAIVLNSKSSVNRATAKGTLTQMINIVFKRMESELQTETAVHVRQAAEPHRRNDEQVSDGSSAKAATVTVEELLVGDADIKGLEAALDRAVQSEGGVVANEGIDLENLRIGQREALLVFRTLCKMSMKDGTDEMVMKTKVLSLELIQGLLESVSSAFTTNFAFIDSIKAYLCYALLRACVSPNPAIFQNACGIFMVLLLRFRESLKAEIGVFFSLIILRSLDSVDAPLQQRISVLKMLERVCTDSQMLADVFVNYDCDLKLSSLSRMAQGTVAADPALDGSSLQCLVNVVNSLLTSTEVHAKEKLFSDPSTQADEISKATPGLDKTMIGDYLGQHEDFPVAVMHAYVNSIKTEETALEVRGSPDGQASNSSYSNTDKNNNDEMNKKGSSSTNGIVVKSVLAPPLAKAEWIELTIVTEFVNKGVSFLNLNRQVAFSACSCRELDNGRRKEADGSISCKVGEDWKTTVAWEVAVWNETLQKLQHELREWTSGHDLGAHVCIGVEIWIGPPLRILAAIKYRGCPVHVTDISPGLPGSPLQPNQQVYKIPLSYFLDFQTCRRDTRTIDLDLYWMQSHIRII